MNLRDLLNKIYLSFFYKMHNNLNILQSICTFEPDNLFTSGLKSVICNQPASLVLENRVIFANPLLPEPKNPKISSAWKVGNVKNPTLGPAH